MWLGDYGGMAILVPRQSCLIAVVSMRLVVLRVSDGTLFRDYWRNCGYPHDRSRKYLWLSAADTEECVAQAAFSDFSGLKAASGMPFAPKVQGFSAQVSAQSSSVSCMRQPPFATPTLAAARERGRLERSNALSV